MGVARSVTSVSTATFISRIGGYIRDMVIARYFGHGTIADTFYLAFRVPNLFRDLLGEGSLSSSFIPVFAESLQKEGKGKAATFVSAMAGVLLVILGLVTILGIAGTPIIVKMLAWGWRDEPEKLALTIHLTRIMFPFIAWISLAALATAILNTGRIFFIPAMAPLMVSFAEITAVLFFVPKMSIPVEGLAWGVLIGGLLQFLWQLPALLKTGYLQKITLKILPEVKKVGCLLIPVAIGSGVRQVNVLVDQVCATFLEQGSITALYYANRLYQLPLALFGLSVVTVALPSMSAAVANSDYPGLKKNFTQSMRLVLFTLIPASAGLIITGKPIIRMLFEHGAFGREGTELTNIALIYYVLGLVFYAGLRVTSSVFYALHDTRTPMKIAVMAMITNAFLNIVLMRFLRVGGLSLATSVAAALNMVCLMYILRGRIGALGVRGLLRYAGRVSLAAGGMGVFCFLALAIFEPSWLHTVFVLAGAVLVYGILSYALQIEELRYIIKKLRR